MLSIHVLDGLSQDFFSSFTSIVPALIKVSPRSIIVLGFHIISYFLGLYMLDKFLGFISPKDEEDVTSSGSVLPTRESDEFRPFRRAVKELDLW